MNEDSTPVFRKRAGIDPANILDGPRAKRRKETTTTISFTIPGRGKRASQTPPADDAAEKGGESEAEVDETYDEEASHTQEIALKLLEAARSARASE